MSVRVANAEESGALDAAGIASGIPSRALMRAAAFNAASVLCFRYPEALRRGVTIFAGPGNNGGDGWALAGALHAVGVEVTVREVASAKTADAIAERDVIRPNLPGASVTPCGLVVDAMLGTGSTGAPRPPVSAAVAEVAAARLAGSIVVALDLPSGVDANTGAAAGSVTADFTIGFGTCKRGALISRAECGEIVIIDIGLGATADALPILVDGNFVRANTPDIAPDAHKGTRKSVAIVAGAGHMAGSAILAATGALRSGAGLVKVITASQNIASVHSCLPEALAAPLEDTIAAVTDWADVVLIGPGLGRDEQITWFIHETLRSWRGPVVLDADALNAFDGQLDELAGMLRDRAAIITPHPGEMARLTGHDVGYVLKHRFDIGLEVSRRIGATVLLKGTPTVVTSPGGERHVIASGTPLLATGGSGDALGGMIATLFAQGCAPDIAASCAAWVHGRAAELTPGIRGYRLMDVLDRLPQAWSLDAAVPRYPILASLATLA
ncbi:MAG: NAD(P)H-hydrate dehydratase [Gemmatimonadaceae bacterium]